MSMNGSKPYENLIIAEKLKDYCVSRDHHVIIAEHRGSSEGNRLIKQIVNLSDIFNLIFFFHSTLKRRIAIKKIILICRNYYTFLKKTLI